jgi:hypothetical protein
MHGEGFVVAHEMLALEKNKLKKFRDISAGAEYV